MNIRATLDQLKSLLNKKPISDAIKKDFTTSLDLFNKSKGTPSDTYFLLNGLQLCINKMSDNDQLEFLKITAPLNLAILKNLINNPYALQHDQTLKTPQYEPEQKEAHFNIPTGYNNPAPSMAGSRNSMYSTMSMRSTTVAQAKRQQTAAVMLEESETNKIWLDLGTKRSTLLEKLVAEYLTLKSPTPQLKKMLEDLSLFFMFKRDYEPAFIIEHFRQKNAGELKKLTSNPFDKLITIATELDASQGADTTKKLHGEEMKKIFKNISSFISFLSTTKEVHATINNISKYQFENLNLGDTAKTQLKM